LLRTAYAKVVLSAGVESMCHDTVETRGADVVNQLERKTSPKLLPKNGEWGRVMTKSNNGRNQGGTSGHKQVNSSRPTYLRAGCRDAPGTKGARYLTKPSTALLGPTRTGQKLNTRQRFGDGSCWAQSFNRHKVGALPNLC